MEAIEEAIQRYCTELGSKHGSDGAKIGCVRISSISELGSMAFMLFSAFEKKQLDEKGKEVGSVFCPPENVILIFDLSRACSGQMAKEAAFMGTLETLLGKTLSTSKYQGKVLTWVNQPYVLIAGNARPIEYKTNQVDGTLLRNADGSIGYLPICHLSAHRIIGKVYTIKRSGGQLLLVQDRVCDELAVAVREYETAAQLRLNQEIECVKPLTKQELFVQKVTALTLAQTP